MSVLHLGRFDSEPLWRAPERAQLPGATDPRTATIIDRMDEMLFAVGEPSGHKLMTRFPMNPAHVDYLHDAGFRFTSRQPPLPHDPLAPSTCGLLADGAPDAPVAAFLEGVTGCVPYSILPTTRAFVERYGLAQPLPALAAVKRVNSKVFSHRIAQETLDECDGQVIDSAQALEAVGTRLLAATPVLLKDDLGVSGKGNLLVDSPRLLARIARHLERQERQGKETWLVLEPLLKKALDFSCQLEIGPNGETSILSIQQMANKGFAFSSITTAEPALWDRLDRDGYLERAQRIAARLFDEGYFGPVCIDSMELADGRVRTLVEINARQSMGYMNHRIDRHLEPLGVRGELSLFSLGVPRHFDYEQLLTALADHGLLFTQDHPEGMLPLSANTLTANLPATNEQALSPGRLYASIVAGGAPRRREIGSQVGALFSDLGMRVFDAP